MKPVSSWIRWVIWTLGALASLPAVGLDLGNSVQIHGFGGWAYGDTDTHSYVVGTPDGEYDNAEFTLNLTAEVSDRLSIVAQVHYDTDALETTELDYAFAEWTFSDLARLRAGRVKHPFGIYGEIPDVGTLRPFQFLPQSIYGNTAFTAKYYDGIGLTGDWFLSGDRWRLQYDLYGGQIQGDFDTVGRDLNITRGLFTVSDTLGLRLRLATPLPGLAFSLSAYQGDDTVVNSEGPRMVDRETVVLSAEYLGASLWVRAEAGRLRSGENHRQDSAYLETAYKLTESWQIAARYETSEIIQTATDLPPVFAQLFNHQDLAFGVNYWFSPRLVFRVAYHQVEGNLITLASREDLLNAFRTGQLEDETNLLTFGAQFSF